MIRLSGLVREHGEHEKYSPVDPKVAYLSPDQGPFMCDHCKYFEAGQRACHIVEGDIDPHGCCNLYTKNPAHFQTGEA